MMNASWTLTQTRKFGQSSGDKALNDMEHIKKGNIGYTFGGNYAVSSDSGFGQVSKYLLWIHDRRDVKRVRIAPCTVFNKRV